jgi:hypothetical protein
VAVVAVAVMAFFIDMMLNPGQRCGESWTTSKSWTKIYQKKSPSNADGLSVNDLRLYFALTRIVDSAFIYRFYEGAFPAGRLLVNGTRPERHGQG